MITYGNGECFVDYTKEKISTIVIHYKGSVYLKHKFMSVDSMFDNGDALLNRVNRDNLLLEGNNQIHIGFLKQPKNLNKLFDYNGDFKITSAKINDQVVTVKATNVDFYELIDSNWDNAGEPEQYKGTYVVGKVPRKRKLIGGTKTSSKARTSVRRAITGSTSSGGGY